tara:strand:- start:2479 stop:3099 length:621 start_codon:yes stop_codon:yes gene_type:complete
LQRKFYGVLRMTHFTELIKKFKDDGKGLMSLDQYLYAAITVKMLAPCNFLVFGLGEDSPLWEEFNKGGRTVFLEDDKEWIKQFDDQGLEIYDVTYSTKVEDHKKIGFDPEKLKMDLPDTISETKWDLIFVDGPLGHQPPRPYQGPGRMQSIYTAHSLLRDDGICIIDDLGREVEQNYALHYFGEINTLMFIDQKVGIFKKDATHGE